MIVGSEWLDLREVLLGINKNLKNENPNHEFLIVDCFDVLEDDESRNNFMDKITK